MQINKTTLPADWNAPEQALKDKIILLTGAGDGIGKALAMDLARLGATIILLGKTTSKLEKVYDQIEQAGYPQAAIYPMNLEGAAPKDFADLAEVIEKNFGHLDALISNAAMLGDMAPIKSYDPKTWLRTMQVDLNAPFFLVQALIPVIQQSGHGKILFTLDQKTRAYWGAYGVAKHALQGFISILAHELDDERFPIQVCGINPGPARTNMRAISYPGESFDEVPPPESKSILFEYALIENINNALISFADNTGCS